MVTKLNGESFIATIRRSGLVEAERLQKLVQSYQEEGGNVGDSDALSDYLIDRNAITRWQGDKLQQGKHKGFFLGKYRLLSLLGKGGMSSVFLAEHIVMRRRCAIKVLPSKRVADTSYLGRFHREAQAVASLDHPNIVRAYDVDHQADRDTDIHFLVMEYVEGQSLQELVQRQGPVGFDDAVNYMRQSALGLEHAHQAGMVHRDIKPGNLLVDLSGTVKVLDLGLARFFSDSGDDALTIQHDEKVLGTADYLAPEQAIDSHSVDERADIYSLGCTLYFLLTGQPPFTEGTLAQRLMAHQTKLPPSVKVKRPDTPDSLEQILLKMMAKKPEDRYATAAETADVLTKWLWDNADDAWKQAHQRELTGYRPDGSPHTSSIPNSSGDVGTVEDPGSSILRDPPQAPELSQFLSSISNEPVLPTSSKVRKGRGSGTKLPPAPPAELPNFDFLGGGPPPAEAPPAFSFGQSDTPATAGPADSGTRPTKKSSVVRKKPASAAEIAIPVRKPSPEEIVTAEPVEEASAADSFSPASSGSYRDSAVRSGRKKKSGLSALPVNAPQVRELIDRIGRRRLLIAGGALAGALILGGAGLYFAGIFGSGGALPKGDDPSAVMASGKKDPKWKDRTAAKVGPKEEFKSIAAALAKIRANFQSRGSKKFVLTVLPGTYEEAIVIDARGNDSTWPAGIVVRGEGDVTIKPAAEDRPALQLLGIQSFTLENVTIDADGQAVGIEVGDYLTESVIRKVTVTNFSESGILGSGPAAVGEEFAIEECTFEKADAKAVGIRLQGKTLELVTCQKNRFLGPLAAGIETTNDETAQRQVYAGNTFSQCEQGIRLRGKGPWLGLSLLNNTFHKGKDGIVFDQMPASETVELKIRRNLFVDVKRAEAIVSQGYDEAKWKALAEATPGGIAFNFSDQAPAVMPPPGVLPIFGDGGRQSGEGLKYVSQEPTNAKFLAPQRDSAHAKLGATQEYESEWIGANGP